MEGLPIALAVLALIAVIVGLSNDFLNSEVNRDENIDADSGETIRDTEPLDESKFISDIPSDFPGQPDISVEHYLRGVCSSEYEERFQEFVTTKYPVKIGYYAKEGWTACLPFYLFQCPDCTQWSVGHKHGMKPKLKCSECGNLIFFYRFKPSIFPY